MLVLVDLAALYDRIAALLIVGDGLVAVGIEELDVVQALAACSRNSS